MKEQPASMLLIEQDKVTPNVLRMWKLVNRETSYHGLVPGPMPMIAQYPDIEQARKHLRDIKGAVKKNEQLNR